MNTDMPSPELSRLIKVRPLPGAMQVVEADAEERRKLAARFGLSAIESLRAEVTLEEKPSGVRATGTLRAAFDQPCAISAEDFRVEVEEAIDLKFTPASTAPAQEEAEIEVELDEEDCDEIDFTGDTFDLGEAVAQTLGLAIDPYAEGPGADAARAKAGITQEGEEEGPLAQALKGLTKG